MAIYTVHEPPLRTGAAASDLERYAFVRDGFSFWAFILAPFWMLRYRMWLVLLAYVVTILTAVTLRVAGASVFVVGCIGFLISLLIGLEASTLRRFTLRRQGWKYAGVVSGEDRQASEQRFFATWLQRDQRPAAPVITASAFNPSLPRTSDIIGLFPQPGAGR